MSDLNTRTGLYSATLVAATCEKNGDQRWATISKASTFAALAAHLSEGTVRVVPVTGGGFKLSAFPVDGELIADDEIDLPDAIRTYADGRRTVSHTARGAAKLDLPLTDPLAMVGLDGNAITRLAKEAEAKAETARRAAEAARLQLAEEAAASAEAEAEDLRRQLAALMAERNDGEAATAAAPKRVPVRTEDAKPGAKATTTPKPATPATSK